MVRSVSFTSPYDAQQAELERKAQYAEALRQQGLEPIQGGMAGRVYVGPSWTQGLAQMLKAYGGRKGVEMANQQSMDLANQRQRAMVEALKNFGTNPEALLENPDTAALGIGAIQRREDLAARKSEREEDMAWRQQQAEALQRWRSEEAERQRAFQAEQMEANRRAQAELAALRGQLGGGVDPYYLFLPGADGYYVGNARTGEITPGMVDGQRAIPGALDPGLQGAIAGAKKGAQVTEEARAKAAVELPQTIANADQTIGLIDQILAHPGLEDAVGVKGASMGFGLLSSPIPGTKAADFNALLKQLEGKQFLEAFESLKGGGHITEIEGEKATNAIAAMQTAQSEAQFKQAAKAFRDVVEGAKRRAIQRAQGGSPGATGSFDAPPATATAGDLTPEEMAEMEQLRRELGL